MDYFMILVIWTQFREEGADWLGGFEDSSKATWFSWPWSWETWIEFVSSRSYCVLIWFFNALTSILSWLTSCLNSLIVIDFERFDPCTSLVSITCFMLKGCMLNSVTLSLSNKFLWFLNHFNDIEEELFLRLIFCDNITIVRTKLLHLRSYND